MTSREETILQELQRNNDTLAALGEDDSFTARIVRMQTVDRNQFLETKLQEVRTPALDFELGGDAVTGHAVPAELLGVLVTRLQRAITWTASSIRYGPSDREPPIAIQRSTAVDVVAFAPGSFRVHLRRKVPEDQMQERIAEADAGLLASSVLSILGFVEDAERGDFSDEIEQRARAIGPRPAAILRLFAKKLADSGADARFEWRAEEVRRATLSPAKAKALADWLGSVEYEQREISVRGTLVAADAEKGTFALRDTQDNLMGGKASPDLVDHAEINAVYQARLRVITSIAEHTASTVDRYELIELSEI